MSRRLLPYGESAVLLECQDLDDALGVLHTLHDEPLPEVTEVVPGARTLLLRLSGPLSDVRRRQILALTPTEATAQEAEPVDIEVDYAGEDLEEVARFCDVTPAEVVRLHTEQTWTVGFCGFAPGFGYLHGEHDRLRVPRRSSPRTKVPAGSVALADQWSAVYPREGPGGWQLIGTTDKQMWDLAASPPALLQPGRQVRFRRMSGPS